jgi:RsiW-degrading membrane proteinase PrsW (M82 family)
VKYQTRFVSQKPAKVVLSSMEVVAQSMGFKTHIRNFKVDFSAFAIIVLLIFQLFCFVYSFFKKKKKTDVIVPMSLPSAFFSAL